MAYGPEAMLAVLVLAGGPGLLAAAGLITDYVLTVAVSISSGLAAVTSAVPSLEAAVVPIGLALIAFLLAANLRGVRQVGAPRPARPLLPTS